MVAERIRERDVRFRRRSALWAMEPTDENRNLLIFSFRYMFKHEQSFYLLTMENGMADERADQQSAVIAFRASVPDRKWTGPASARH